MGNSPSKPAVASSSPAVSSDGHSSREHRRKEPVRRDSNSLHSSTVTKPTSAASSPLTATSLYQSATLPSVQKPASYHISGEGSPNPRHERPDKMGNTHSRQDHADKLETKKKSQDREEEQSSPVRVPRGKEARRQRGPDTQFEPSGPPRDPEYIPHSNLNFPPRLPLPIQEEIHTPGSPIISPTDLSTALQEDDVEGALPRRSSILSSTTVDDDDLGDELQGYMLDTARGRTVPTLVEWKQGGERVYVTGTFASWSRKYRMHREYV